MSDPYPEDPGSGAEAQADQGEDIRVHSQDPAEGPDPDTNEDDDVSRVHTQDPAEGR